MIIPLEPPLEIIREASSTCEPERLAHLAQHKSHYVRVRVAGNPCIPEVLHRQLLKDMRSSVVFWALTNKRSHREHFEIVFKRMQQEQYDGMVHPVLASSVWATLDELTQLSQLRRWGVDIGILNNHNNRDKERYLKIIAHLLPPEEKDDSQWTEVEALAYFRTFNRRLKPKDEV